MDADERFAHETEAAARLMAPIGGESAAPYDDWRNAAALTARVQSRSSVAAADMPAWLAALLSELPGISAPQPLPGSIPGTLAAAKASMEQEAQDA